MKNSLITFDSYAAMMNYDGIKRTAEYDHLPTWDHVASACAFVKSKYIVVNNLRGIPMQVVWVTEDDLCGERICVVYYRKKLRPVWIKSLKKVAATLLGCRQKDITFVDDRIDPNEE